MKIKVGAIKWTLNEELQTCHLKTWNGDCKMGTKAKLFCREVEGVGVNKMIFNLSK